MQSNIKISEYNFKKIKQKNIKKINLTKQLIPKLGWKSGLK